ncbi:hypothetical protein [Actinoplanes sp. NPDC049118]|uniref:hypothetical protein n=1 Tax=Actinoplanes sp. NPDC049118 TaxID=3155769 RepID=UPI0033CCF886
MGPDDPAFLAARRRATARDGVLSGRYALVDGELLPEAYPSWSPQGGQVPPAQVTMSVSFTTVARHREGGVLELRAAEGDAVRAVWWRGPNDSRGETIPDGFVWEKNDDYYHGTVGWADLHEVSVEVRVIPR